ncbi:fumarylacetoacetate hydrolase family protein [Aurantimonas sp. A2-1-M11]|uniref:fumarylacetoacetate hydrolase family protein n=1 Tax=Aurantimonas sp. A2-1-M11 TaxID=3113712 RepID=UPI002F925C12
MKLATIRDGSRDGRLVVVSRDLTQMTDAAFLARTLQAALDDWPRIAPHLAALAESLEAGAVPADRFHEHDAASPLPRAYQWAEGAVYGGHVEDVGQAPGPNASVGDVPSIRQRGSDSFLAPRDPIRSAEDDCGIDMAGGIAVITGDVPMGATIEEAREAIRLVLLVNVVCLRDLAPGDGGDDFQSRPATAFSPVALTPGELGEAWDGARLHGALCVDRNAKPFGRADAGVDMRCDFPTLIAHAARTRPLSAGTIIGAGPVSNRADGGLGKPVDQGGAGYSCLSEMRSSETRAHGSPQTPYLRFGDTVRIEMLDDHHHSIFGAIEQTVERYQRP